MIIILVFGLVITNLKLFFPGKAKVFLEKKKMKQVYHELQIITMETAFVVCTFFFVIFGVTMVLTSLLSLNVAIVSILIIASIYVIRFLILRVFIGKDIMHQVFIAPRGLGLPIPLVRRNPQINSQFTPFYNIFVQYFWFLEFLPV